MYQETTTAIQAAADNPETMGKAISFGAIGFNVLIMSLTVAMTLTAYALKSYNTEVSSFDWVRSNKFRWFMGLVLIIGLSILTVITPDINLILTAIGFNPEKSPVALGIAITLLLIGATSQPTKVPKGSI